MFGHSSYGTFSYASTEEIAVSNDKELTGENLVGISNTGNLNLEQLLATVATHVLSSENLLEMAGNHVANLDYISTINSDIEANFSPLSTLNLDAILNFFNNLELSQALSLNYSYLNKLNSNSSLSLFNLLKLDVAKILVIQPLGTEITPVSKDNIFNLAWIVSLYQDIYLTDYYNLDIAVNRTLKFSHNQNLLSDAEINFSQTFSIELDNSLAITYLGSAAIAVIKDNILTAEYLSTFDYDPHYNFSSLLNFEKLSSFSANWLSSVYSDEELIRQTLAGLRNDGIFPVNWGGVFAEDGEPSGIWVVDSRGRIWIFYFEDQAWVVEKTLQNWIVQRQNTTWTFLSKEIILLPDRPTKWILQNRPNTWIL